MLDQTIFSPKATVGEETRSALIAAATDVFLSDGFRAARVTDIAKRAGQRVSAINYHFTSKEGLYLAVLRHHAELALQQTPLAMPAAQLSPQEKLAFAITALVERLLCPESPSRIGALMLREMVNPTPALEVLFERFSLPQAEIVITLVREIVGEHVPEESVKRCAMSIFGQCAAYVFARPLISRIAPEIYQGETFTRRIVDHVLTFSWAGLLAVRQQWEKTI